MTIAAKRSINPATIRKPFARYSHGLLVPPGATIIVNRDGEPRV